MSKKNQVESLAVEVYGDGVQLANQELAPGFMQVAVVHPSGIPLVLVTAGSLELGYAGLEGALKVVKAG